MENDTRVDYCGKINTTLSSRLDMISQQIQEPFKMQNSIVRVSPQRGFYREPEGLPFFNNGNDGEGVEGNYIDLRRQTLPPPFVLPTRAYPEYSQVGQRTADRAQSEVKPPFIPPPSQIEKLKTKVKHLERDKANLQIQMRLLREDYEEKMWNLRQELEATRVENASLLRRTTDSTRQQPGESKIKSPEQKRRSWSSQNPLFMTPGRITYHHENSVVERQADTCSESTTSASIRSGGHAALKSNKDLELIDSRSVALRSAKTSVWTSSSTAPSKELTPPLPQSSSKYWCDEESPGQKKEPSGQRSPGDGGGDGESTSRKGKPACYVYTSIPRARKSTFPNRRRRPRNNWFRDWLYPEFAVADPEAKQIPTQTPSPPPSMIIP